MRILISLSYYTPNISGLTNSAKILAEELSKKGNEVTILTSQHNKNLLSQENKNGVKIIRVPVSFRLGKGPIMFSLPFRAWKYVEQADVVNCHLPQFESFILVLLAKIKHKKVILTYQTDLSWSGGLLLKISKIAMLISHLISAIFAEKIVASSKDYANNSRFLKLFSKKLIYIYPPMRLAKADNLVLKSFEERLQLKEKHVIGTLTRISPEKGIEYLLEAIPYLADKLGYSFTIIIAGPPKPIGEDNYFRKIETLSKKYNKYVKFIGELSDEGLKYFYKSLDVFVLPSINATEAFGMVQVEAMFYGVPVVATDLPGVRVPITETGMGKIAYEKNSADLAEKIIEVLEFKTEYKKRKSMAEEKFSLKHTLHQYERLFE